MSEHSLISRRKLLMLAVGAAASPIMSPLVRAAEGGRCVVSTFAGDYGRLLAENIDKPIMSPKGIEVIQDTGSDPVRTAKLIAQQRLPRGSVDVICLSAQSLNDMNEAGLLEQLDTEKVPNLKYVRTELKSSYGIPHIYSPQVIAYNPDRVKVPPKTFTNLLADSYREKVGMLDQSFAYILMAASLENFKDVSHLEESKPAVEKMLKRGDHVYTTTEAFAPAIRSGEIDVGMMWHARVMFWRAAGVPIAASFPTEGSVVYVSSMGIPKNAPNKKAAFAYLDAALDPSAQRSFSKTLKYLPTVTNAPLQGTLANELALPNPTPLLLQPNYAALSKVRDGLYDWWRSQLAGH